tara:strand:- start:1115 stop:1288 length:174 start_codon:yes stop_codon:yes gene_type:complete
MSYKPTERMWSIKAVKSLQEMETVLNDLQDEGYTIKEVNTNDLVIIYYKEKPKRIDD